MDLLVRLPTSATTYRWTNPNSFQEKTQMTSFQITLSPSKRAAARFVNNVRRKLQQALAEESQKSGLTQTDIANTIGVHRSVINRELRGRKDITLGRVAELASAMGRKAELELPERTAATTRVSNISLSIPANDDESDDISNGGIKLKAKVG
jgi:transcriptional regulator with XRE-family HTH domain